MPVLLWTQVSAARSSLEAQLAASRAEVSVLTSQLAELRGSLAAARDSVVAAEMTATRLQGERVRLSKVRGCADLCNWQSNHIAHTSDMFSSRLVSKPCGCHPLSGGA